MAARPSPAGEPARRRARPRWLPALTAFLLVTLLTMLVYRAPPRAAADGPLPPPLLNAFMLAGFTGNGIDGLYAA
ncbi:MAG TPA: hypothetical protein VFW96_27245, partial [Thermomicrobiales bacterium]|nr:hypothetical protein [Thermomicrobiales bacterium]